MPENSYVSGICFVIFRNLRGHSMAVVGISLYHMSHDLPIDRLNSALLKERIRLAEGFAAKETAIS